MFSLKQFKISFILWLMTLLLFACKVSNYKYFPPTANPTLFHNKNEVHVSGEINSAGLTTKGAFAVTNRIGIMGMYNSGIYNYQSREGELAAGYYKPTTPFGMYMSGGLGWGNNFAYTDTTRTTKSYQGNFTRPFVQMNMGINSSLGKLGFDATFCLKGSYLFYNGKYLDGSNDYIKSEYFILEPAMALGIGTRVFLFDLLLGFPFHPSPIDKPLSPYSNARTFPINAGFGIRFVFAREKE